MTENLNRTILRKLLIPAALCIPAAVMTHIVIGIVFAGKEGALYRLIEYAVAVAVLLILVYQALPESSVREIIRRTCIGISLAAFAIPAATVAHVIISPVKDPMIPVGLTVLGALVGGAILGTAALGVANIVGD